MQNHSGEVYLMQLTLDGVDKQDALAVLRNKSLERIDGGEHRVYRDAEGK